jgi:hypothetical protein
MSVLSTIHRAFSRRERGTTRSFHEAAREAGVLQQRLPRAETVDTARIVGSVGRARELDHTFRPIQRRHRKPDNERFESVLKAMKRGRALPPIQLYRLGHEYFVLDGHHRVAAALHLGQLAMDAHVIEFRTAVQSAN